MTQVVGIDIGGSGVKGAIVDVEEGELVTDRTRIPTPQPSTPKAVLDVAAGIAQSFDWHGPIGCALPSVVRHGVVYTAANIDPSWVGRNAEKMLKKRTGCDVVALNDADAAGIAEVRFGAGKGRSGVLLVLTFGTGIGSALFVDGKLVPNTELGHVRFRGGPAEHYAAARLVERDDMRIDWWASRVNEYLVYLERVFSPDLFIFGGGISKRFGDFAEFLETTAEVVPAELRNNAGIVGAALAAADRLG